MRTRKIWGVRYSTHALIAQRSWAHTVWLNMMDREDTAGHCVDDVCSHQSFNLSLSSLTFLLATFCHTQPCCLSPSSSATHYEKHVCAQSSCKTCYKAEGVSEERWYGRQRRVGGEISQRRNSWCAAAFKTVLIQNKRKKVDPAFNRLYNIKKMWFVISHFTAYICTSGVAP